MKWLTDFCREFIAALNSLNTPWIAVLVIIIGCVYSLLCKHFGLDERAAAEIQGAGIGLLTGQILSKASQPQDLHLVNPPQNNPEPNK